MASAKSREIHNKQPGKLWRAAVLAKKQEMLHEKNKHIPTDLNVKGDMPHFKPNKVEVVKEEYIDQMFKTFIQADERLINGAIKEFLLNEEQERAFRIIANYATIKIPEK